ncbi:MAG: amino acid ABC transporter ATP-binding protein, partial [Verrucomicrobiota bacterium]
VQSAGETAVLFGGSGCGKSTLLRCLNQLERADAGRIRIAGHDIDPAEEPPVEALRRLRCGVGMVFQQFHLFSHRTALENVMEGPLHVLGRLHGEVRQEALDLLSKVGLEGHADQFPHQLSGGQQQRVAIARALAMKPQVLLLDEPTSALDPQLREEVRRVLRGLAEEGMTMLVVTHDLRLARQIADRAAFLDGGRILESGPAEQVFGNPVQERTRRFLEEVRS